MHKIYNDLVLLSMNSPEQVTWVTLFKEMLFQYGFGYVWEQQSVQNENVFLRIFEQRLKDTFLQDWDAQVRSTSDYRLFKKIKDSFKFESYLNSDNRIFRIAITKVRLSSHLFFIERERWGRPKINAVNRKCNLCNSIEDEYHCLIE